jgi:hypothetical protein
MGLRACLDFDVPLEFALFSVYYEILARNQVFIPRPSWASAFFRSCVATSLQVRGGRWILAFTRKKTGVEEIVEVVDRCFKNDFDICGGVTGVVLSSRRWGRLVSGKLVKLHWALPVLQHRSVTLQRL